ncbi:MAG: hypothetical protein JXO51_05635, partial [Candidatus Aminicenantes bacterium]|nr:hypothetical protein [Candidatus Aminicenantes bacterium]
MYLSRRKLSPEFVKKAAAVSTVTLVAIFTALIAAFWGIQVVHHDKYKQLAIRNITRTFGLPAPRGLIVDRSGNVLAENGINFTLYLVREKVQDPERALRRAAFFSGKDVAAVRV